MTKLLVCAATRTELETFLDCDEALSIEGPTFETVMGSATLAVTGVGIPATLLRLPELIRAAGPELVLNIGIAGAYPGAGLSIGDITMATTEVIGDIGFEIPDERLFLPATSAPFGAFYKAIPMRVEPAFLISEGEIRAAIVEACTVNCCTGTLRTGLLREALFGVGIESMEGAAVALACFAAGVPVCEVRAISNLAADRDMRQENIQLALSRLNAYLQACRAKKGL